MTSQQSARITVHYGFALLAVLAFVGTVVPTFIMFAAAANSVDGTQGGDAGAGVGAGFAIMWLLWGAMWTLIWAAFAINHTLKARGSTS